MRQSNLRWTVFRNNKKESQKRNISSALVFCTEIIQGMHVVVAYLLQNEKAKDKGRVENVIFLSYSAFAASSLTNSVLFYTFTP